MRDRFDVPQSVRRGIVGWPIGLPQHAIGLFLHLRLDLRTLGHQMHHPGQGIGGRVFAREQHGQGIADDLFVAERPVSWSCADDHGLKKVGWSCAQCRICIELGVAAGDQRIDQLAHLRERRVQLSILREFEVAPVGIRAREPAGPVPGKIFSKWRWIGSADCSSVFRSLPKTRPLVTSTVKRIRSRCASTRVSIACRTLPAPLQPRGYLLEPSEEFPQVIGVQRVHRQLALSPPVRAFGREDSVDAELEHDIAHQLATLK